MLSPVADLVARSCLRMSCQRGHTEATSVAYNIYIGIDTCLAEPLARMLRLKHATQAAMQLDRIVLAGHALVFRLLGRMALLKLPP